MVTLMMAKMSKMHGPISSDGKIYPSEWPTANILSKGFTNNSYRHNLPSDVPFALKFLAFVDWTLPGPAGSLSSTLHIQF